jgi:hypothetical protein
MHAHPAHSPPASLTQDDKGESKLKACNTQELLERLPLAHKLLSRLIACVPQGSATANEIVIQSCSLVSIHARQGHAHKDMVASFHDQSFFLPVVLLPSLPAPRPLLASSFSPFLPSSCHPCLFPSLPYQVLKEVKAVYRLVSEGLMNLVDKFFEMDR